MRENRDRVVETYGVSDWSFWTVYSFKSTSATLRIMDESNASLPTVACIYGIALLLIRTWISVCIIRGRSPMDSELDEMLVVPLWVSVNA